MMAEKDYIRDLRAALSEYEQLGIAQQIDYQKFYLYSIITHSTAIEGSTVTEIENQLLFDEGIAAKGRTMVEQLMNLDLKSAYEQVIKPEYFTMIIKSVRNLTLSLWLSKGKALNL